VIAPTLCSLAAVVALLVAERREMRWGKWLFKAVASAGFVVTAWIAASGHCDIRHAATPPNWIFIALCLSFVGDLFLVVKAKAAFLAGLFTFLLAHVAFAIGFWSRAPSLRVTLATLAGLAGIGALVARWLWPHMGQRMRGPVALYLTAITIMVALAAGTFAAHGDAWVLVAASAFYLSDLAVARQQFVATGFGNKAIGLPLYYGAQLLFAWSA
jgi:uncharacterized membrane protein YhhN